ncbi:hypothetical protein QR680_009813 [Steinernema hermaphroditum]|uniref:cyclin-dependent kinase n=1 Tax=Steinernema hermaphroditum TaxID=289476 RepID=A0AA39ILQ8_9BILA|nr:hypothetical protein QR680_009813 [Steinernema hermaphroditum]
MTWLLLFQNLGLRTAMEKYLKLEKIGEGTYGVVFKGQLRSDKKEFVAMKRIRMDLDNEGVPSTAMREIAILKELSHPNIVGLKDVIIARNKRNEMQLHLIFEYIDMDLRMFLDKIHKTGNKMNLPIVKSFTHQLLKGLAYIHVRRMLHRDLKPQNILVHSNGLVKLADFGLARAFSLPGRVYTHEVVTLWYRPPEILIGGNYYTTAVDIWSLACIIAEMIKGDAIFKGDSEIDQLFRIFRVFGTPTDEIWKGITQMECYSTEFPKWPIRTVGDLLPDLEPAGINFLTLMFVMNPKNRATARYCLGHEFLNSTQFEAQYDVLPCTEWQTASLSGLHSLRGGRLPLQSKSQARDDRHFGEMGSSDVPSYLNTLHTWSTVQHIGYGLVIAAIILATIAVIMLGVCHFWLLRDSRDEIVHEEVSEVRVIEKRKKHTKKYRQSRKSKPEKRQSKTVDDPRRKSKKSDEKKQEKVESSASSKIKESVASRSSSSTLPPKVKFASDVNFNNQKKTYPEAAAHWVAPESPGSERDIDPSLEMKRLKALAAKNTEKMVVVGQSTTSATATTNISTGFFVSHLTNLRPTQSTFSSTQTSTEEAFPALLRYAKIEQSNPRDELKTGKTQSSKSSSSVPLSAVSRSLESLDKTAEPSKSSVGPLPISSGSTDTLEKTPESPIAPLSEKTAESSKSPVPAVTESQNSAITQRGVSLGKVAESSKSPVTPLPIASGNPVPEEKTAKSSTVPVPAVTKSHDSLDKVAESSKSPVAPLPVASGNPVPVEKTAETSSVPVPAITGSKDSAATQSRNSLEKTAESSKSPVAPIHIVSRSQIPSEFDSCGALTAQSPNTTSLLSPSFSLDSKSELSTSAISITAGTTPVMRPSQLTPTGFTSSSVSSTSDLSTISTVGSTAARSDGIQTSSTQMTQSACSIPSVTSGLGESQRDNKQG